MDSKTPVPMKQKCVLKQHQLENLQRGREARMKKLEDKKFLNEPNIQEQDTKILPDIPEQPINI